MPHHKGRRLNYRPDGRERESMDAWPGGEEVRSEGTNTRDITL